MARTSYPHASTPILNETQWEEFAEHWLRTGVIAAELNELLVYADSTGMQVKVQSGKGHVKGRYFKSDAEYVQAIAAADPANPRIDRVILRLNRTAGTLDFALLQGAPAVTPAAPAVTQNTTLHEISLAQVRVDAAVGTIAAAKVTDERLLVKNANLRTDDPRENQLVNGGFEIWQRGAGAFTANNAYTADRWQISLAGTDAMSVSRDSANADTGSQYCAAITYTFGNSGSDLLQKLEDYSQLRGRTLTVSVRVKCATANVVRVGIDDAIVAPTYSARNSAGGWQTLTATATISATAVNIRVRLRFDNNTSGVVYADNATVVVGSVAADYSPLTPQEDLSRCQRYYEVIDGRTVSLFANCTAGNQYPAWPVFFKATKAVTPTITTNGVWAAVNSLHNPPLVGGIAPEACYIYVGSAGAGIVSFGGNTADDTITVEANP